MAWEASYGKNGRVVLQMRYGSAGIERSNMGLDIRAFKGLKEVKNPQLNQYGELIDWENQWNPGASMEWSESVWPGKGKPINPKSVYEWEDCYHFRAGSYSGYNWWRDKLNEFAGNVAFQELIDFADNEGVIGSELSKKLYDDFQKYHEKAFEFSKTLDDAEWWFDKYHEWEKAFEMAKDGGAVEFG